jgi:6-phosphogluconolactonase
MSTREIRISADSQQLFRDAATEFARIANEAVKQRGRFTVALSGGSTPRNLYSLLATDFRSQVPWGQSLFFWGDERHVAPDNPESNYRMSYESLLSKVPVPPQNIYRVAAEDPDASVAAEAYERTLRQVFTLAPGEFPRFDLILLGMGPDGHAASLFPGSLGLSETKKLVIANWVEKFKTYRITFTFPVINNAACVMFLAGGSDKAVMLKDVLEGHSKPPYPAQQIKPTGRLLWMVDRAAAADLKK